MSEDDWRGFHARWSRLRPPLRADAEVAAAIAECIRGSEARVLLLGVTPELAGLGIDLTAIDWSEAMVRHIWPGDRADRRARVGNWLTLGPAEPGFTAVIGDGSLNTLSYTDYPALFARLAGLLAPGARLAVRVYLVPEGGEMLAAVRRATIDGAIRGFHAFKWRLAMAVAQEAGRPDVAVAAVHCAFQAYFPDRKALSFATGWPIADIDEIDAYRDSAAVYSFPTRNEVLAALPAGFAAPRFVAAGHYELAERCPLLVAETRK